MNDLNVEIKSFEDFLAEDAKAISDANHRAKNGDCVADKVVEPSEHKHDEKGIKTDPRHAAANKEQGDGKTPPKLQEGVEGDQKVGDKKDKLVSDDDEDEGDEKKSDEEE